MPSKRISWFEADSGDTSAGVECIFSKTDRKNFSRLGLDHRWYQSQRNSVFGARMDP